MDQKPLSLSFRPYPCRKMLKNNEHPMKVATWLRMKAFFHFAISTMKHAHASTLGQTKKMNGKHKTVLIFEFCKPKYWQPKSDLNQNKLLNFVQSNFTRKHHGANKKWWCGQTFCFNLYQNMQSFNACDWISSHATSVFVEGLYDQFDFPLPFAFVLQDMHMARNGARAWCLACFNEALDFL